MVRYLSEKQKIEILIMRGCGDRQRTQQEVCDLFNLKYPNEVPLARATVGKIEKKFNERGHVNSAPRKTCKIPENVQLNILLEMQENPHSVTRTVAANNDVSQSSVVRYLKKFKWRAYKPTAVQELYGDDPDRRTEFCELMMERCNNVATFLDNLIFTDEATFHVNGTINKQNCRYWASENPHWAIEAHTQYPEKVNVWAGIVGNRILGPYFFDGIVTGARYLEFLQNELIPALTALYPNPNDPNEPSDNLWYQHDGAPIHYCVIVRRYLDNMFPRRWIGRRGAIEWPPRSPDLTALDFFLWGYLKSKIYKNRPHSVEDLKNRITAEIRSISPEMLENVKQAFLDRIAFCLEVNGFQFEHLI